MTIGTIRDNVVDQSRQSLPLLSIYIAVPRPTLPRFHGSLISREASHLTVSYRWSDRLSRPFEIGALESGHASSYGADTPARLADRLRYREIAALYRDDNTRQSSPVGLGETSVG